jgi:phosphatidylserine/phosphatidylglycerophosphate/cardiolipin synthase-like enzyme
MIQDPILDRVVSLLSHAKDFKLAILTVVLPPKLKQALLAGLDRGLDVTILTNSRESHSNISPVPISFGWYAGLPDLDEVLMAGAQGYGLRGGSADFYKFLHRKLAIIDDTVIFGSHNLTLSSSYTQDEASFEISSPVFAEKMRSIFQSELDLHADLLNPTDIHQENISKGFRVWLGSKFKWLYYQ